MSYAACQYAPGLGFVTAAATGAAAATGGGASSAGALAAVGGPWGLAVMGGVMATQAILSWISNRGKRKVAATQIVDEAERHLIANLEAFEAGGLSQQQALDNFEQVWAQVYSACSDSTLGDPGRRCISERRAGGQFDWFARYRQPIADAPVQSTFFGGGYAANPQQSGGSLLLPVLAIAAIGIGVML